MWPKLSQDLDYDARSNQVNLLRLQLDTKLCSPNILGIGTSADITCQHLRPTYQKVLAAESRLAWTSRWALDVLSHNFYLVHTWLGIVFQISSEYGDHATEISPSEGGHHASFLGYRGSSGVSWLKYTLRGKGSAQLKNNITLA